MGVEYYDKSNSKEHETISVSVSCSIKMYYYLREVWCAMKNHQRLSVQPRVVRQAPKSPAPRPAELGKLSRDQALQRQERGKKIILTPGMAHGVSGAGIKTPV